MAKSELLPVETLRKLLSYDPHTGVLRWEPRGPDMFSGGKISPEGRARCWNGNLAGKEAGSINNQGYRMVEVMRRALAGHRIAWAMHHGVYPEGQIDHINGDRSDNRASNLRDVSPSGNAKNKKVRSDSTTGMAGIERLPSGNKCWRAFIAINGKRTHLGVYNTADEAVAVREKAKIKHGYHANHGRPNR